MSPLAIDPNIHCSRCQACCCRLPVMLLPDDRPPSRFIDRDDHGAEIMGKGDDGWCLALDRDSMSCSIYAERPWVCRAFEMGSEDCAEVRDDWRRIQLTVL